MVPGGREVCGNTFSSCSWITVSLFTPISSLEPRKAVPTRRERQSSKELPLVVEASRGIEGNSRHRGEQELEARVMLGRTSCRRHCSGVIVCPQSFVSQGSFAASESWALEGDQEARIWRPSFDHSTCGLLPGGGSLPLSL